METTRKQENKKEREVVGRYTIDAYGKKAYLGSKVLYNNKIFLLEEINYLSWNSNQYLTLQDANNQNKKIDFISPESIQVLNTKV